MKEVGQIGFRDDGRTPPIVQHLRGRSHAIVAMRGKGILVVIGVELHEKPDLPEVIQASNTLALLLCLTQSRKQHPCKDGYDGDDNQQLDQCESATLTQGGTLRGEG